MKQKIIEQMSTTEKVEVRAFAASAKVFLERIYKDLDLLSGELGEMIERLDKEEHAWFHDFWMKFPTYNELDDLKLFLTELQDDLKTENY